MVISFACILPVRLLRFCTISRTTVAPSLRYWRLFRLLFFSPAEKRALFSAAETQVPCVFDKSFSLHLQRRINIIESKLESSKKRTSERNADYNSSDAERQRRFNWSHWSKNRSYYNFCKKALFVASHSCGTKPPGRTGRRQNKSSHHLV